MRLFAIVFLCSCLLVEGQVKISDLTETTTAAPTNYLPIVVSPGAVGGTKKIAVGNLLTNTLSTVGTVVNVGASVVGNVPFYTSTTGTKTLEILSANA